MKNDSNKKNKIYLLVPFEKKDSVKKLGARWDSENKGWYIDHPLISKKFNKWLPEMYKHSSQPPFIRLNFFPMATSGHNVRSAWETNEWTALREQLINLTGNRCTICGHRSQNKKDEYIDLDCHEHWEFEVDYKNRTGIQRLKEFIPLCKECHRAAHINILRNKKEKNSLYDSEYLNAFQHLCIVNRWQERECEINIENEISKLTEYQNFNWSVNISIAVTLYKTLVSTELSNTNTDINCYKNQNKENTNYSMLDESDDIYEIEEQGTLDNHNKHNVYSLTAFTLPDEALKQDYFQNNASLKSTKLKNIELHRETSNQAIQNINNVNPKATNVKKLLSGIALIILGTYAYFSLSRPSEPPQSASLTPQSTNPVKIDISAPPQENTNQPKQISKKPQNPYRKCEPVRGQPGAKMCQDHNGQWHLISP